MSQALDRLVAVMARLRDRNGGCAWDLEQDFRSIAPHTLEETYEVVEAIENDDMKGLKEELGDLLFQIAFHAQMGREKNLFDLDSIAVAVTDKMVERHPHVFADRNAETAKDVITNWEADKAAKRRTQAEAENRRPSVLDGVNTALPAPSRALKLQQRAARVGFDWGATPPIFAKIREELGELERELTASPDKGAVEDELGDLLFAVINLARHLAVDPEAALRRTNRKFERRFHAIESALAAQGRTPDDANLEEMDEIWNAERKKDKGEKRSD